MSKQFFYKQKINFIDNNLTPTSTDFRRCREVALYASNATSKYKVGCLIYSGKTIVGTGLSSNKTHPRQKQLSRHPERCYLHAELAALLRIDINNYHNTKLYVIRVLKNGEMADSHPCDSCLAAIIESRIKQVFYFDTNQIKGFYL